MTETQTSERLVVIYGDGSYGICPVSYTLEQAKAESFDKNQPDPHKQAKIGKIRFEIAEILHDPVKENSSKCICPHCNKDIP